MTIVLLTTRSLSNASGCASFISMTTKAAARFECCCMILASQKSFTLFIFRLLERKQLGKVFARLVEGCI